MDKGKNEFSFFDERTQVSEDSKKAPTFTPPAPTFTPPESLDAGQVHDGQACYYHRNSSAVSQCVRCGKNLCGDCHDAYGVVIGEYAGKALCYDCSRHIVSENVNTLKANKNKIVLTFALTLIGMIIGAAVGYEGGGYGILFGACIGGCLWTFLKGWMRRIAGAISGGGFNFVSVAIGIVLGFAIEAVISIFRTIKKVIECIVYIKRTSGFIESDTTALREMADYMEYTKIRDMNKGVDIETLLNQNSELSSNEYARIVRAEGEDAAEAKIRQSVNMINEHGEIIRDFAA